MVFINLFYIINHFLEHNIYRFYLYNRKEGKFFVLEQNLILQFDWFYFPVYLNALYDSYLQLV